MFVIHLNPIEPRYGSIGVFLCPIFVILTGRVAFFFFLVYFCGAGTGNKVATGGLWPCEREPQAKRE